MSKATAEVAKLKAEALAAEALAEKYAEEARKAKAEADGLELEHSKSWELWERNHAKDDYHNVYRFNASVGDASVKDCMAKLAEWARLDSNGGADMTIVFCSPGGSVIDGMALFDYIQELRRDGHRITTKALGYAASMAGILLQAGDDRVMAKESWLMIHEAAFSAFGKTAEVEDTVDWVKRVQNRILNIFAERAAASGVDKPITKAQLKNRWHRKDWWLSSDEALGWGLVDRVE